MSISSAVPADVRFNVFVIFNFSPVVFFILHATAKYFFNAEYPHSYPAGFNPKVRKN